MNNSEIHQLTQEQKQTLSVLCDVTERNPPHLSSLSNQRKRLEGLKFNNPTNERLRLRTLEYLKMLQADHLIFKDFLFEVQGCQGDYKLLNEFLNQEDPE